MDRYAVCLKVVIQMLSWFWCCKCERAFYTVLALHGTPTDCPFSLCFSQDFREWWKVRQVNKAYPMIPLYGVLYPLEPDKDDWQRVREIHEFIRGLERGEQRN